MARQEIIEELQNDIQHNRIDEVELDRACEKYGLNIYDDLLAPIGYNLCDRCGDYGDSEQDLLWVDCYNWDDDSPTDQAILKAIAQEHIEYCALCRECVKELEKKGETMVECDNCRAKIKPTPDFHCPNCGEKIGD